MTEACCTCAKLLADIPPIYDEKTEKPVAQDRRLECCGRVICQRCIHNNSRFASYCPFCQISTNPSILPLNPHMAPPPKPPQYPDPPSYNEEEPPSYSSLASSSHSSAFEKPAPPAEDVLHFIDHDGDTVISLAFRYGVPVDVLRRANNITSDHLLRARRTVIIPGSHYTGGVSLSPRPLEGEEEEIRKGKIRKFMVQCKVSEYDVAVLYLEQSEWYLDGAVEAYLEDERWEREHPLKGVGVKKGISSAAAGRRRFTGQRS